MSARQNGRRTATKTDPIFALIERHSQALKAQQRAAGALASLRARIDARAAERRLHEGRRITSPTALFDIGGRPMDPAKVIRSREEIKPYIWSVFDRAAWALSGRAAARVRNHEREAVEAMLRKYDAFQRAHMAKRQAVGLTAREKADELANRMAFTALSELAKATPATPEERAARAGHLARLSPAQAPWWALRAVLEQDGAAYAPAASQVPHKPSRRATNAQH